MNNSLNQNKICAIIPFYNEIEHLPGIINDTLPFVDKIIAINDGSTDNSAALIPESQEIQFISYPKNKGKGFALNLGFLESIKSGYGYTVTLDADYQHKPEYIPSLLKELDNSDIVIGNRLNKLNRMPIQRILSNKLTSLLLSIKTKTKIIDSQCGFRAYKTSVLESILPTFDGFEAESEILLNAANKNLKISFVYVPTIYNNEKSKMKSFQAIKGFIKVITK